MKFLSVLCVVLYFRFGDFYELQNNAFRSQYRDQESIQFNSPRNIGHPSLYDGYNNVRESQTNNRFVGQHTQESQANLGFELPHISPEYINSYQFNHFNEQPLNQQEDLKLQNQFFPNPQEIGSAYIKPQESHTVYSKFEEKRFNDAQRNQGEVNSGAKIQLQSSVNYVPQFQYKEPTQRILGTNSEHKSDFMYPQIINTKSFKNINTAPIISNEDTKFELQGLSPEFMQSMINQNNMKPKTFESGPRFASFPATEKTNYIENRPIFNNNENSYDQLRARLQSPTAEVLYNMKKALPYDIKNQQLPSTLQSNINFKKSAPNTRRIEDIIRSTPPVKRYMIIHPGGSVEHVDNIEKIIKVHPNYMMVNSQDVIKHLNGETQIPGLHIPEPKETLPVYQHISSKVEQEINKILPLQNLSIPIVANDTKAELSIVSSQTTIKPNNISIAVEVASKKDTGVPNSKEINQNVTTILPGITQNSSDIKSELAITHSLPIIKVNVTSNTELPSENSTDIIPTQKMPLDVALTNATTSTTTVKGNEIKNQTKLENATLISTSTTTEKSNEIKNKTKIENATLISTSTTTEKSNEIKNQTKLENATLISTSTTTEKSNEIKNQTKIENATLISTSTTTEKSNEIKNLTKIENATLVISENSTAQPLLNKSDIGSSPVSQTVSTVKNYKFNVTVLENTTPKTSNSSGIVNNDIEPLNRTVTSIDFNITQPHNVSNIYLSNNTLPYVNNNDSTTNTTEISSKAPPPLIAFLNGTEAPIDGQKSANTSSTIGKVSSKLENVSSPSVNKSNSGGVWFQTDDHFWEHIANSNNTEKFYFLFVPPKPIEKERKTTIYANGTTVEEISETKDEDGIPTVLRTTKVSHANSSTTV